MIGFAMSECKLRTGVYRSSMYWGLICAGLVLAIWQFFTLVHVLQGHTAQARKISQSASWSGHPVGTMPQMDTADAAGLVAAQYENYIGPGMMRADLP